MPKASGARARPPPQTALDPTLSDWSNPNFHSLNGCPMKVDTGTINTEMALNSQAAERTSVAFPLEASIGYQLRATNRLIQRLLQSRIAPYGVTLGMWYFLRALWEEDGLTQSELSQRVGTMDPTTLSAIAGMERE